MDHFQNNQHSFRIWGGDSYNGMGWDGTIDIDRQCLEIKRGSFWPVFLIFLDLFIYDRFVSSKWKLSLNRDSPSAIQYALMYSLMCCLQFLTDQNGIKQD